MCVCDHSLHLSTCEVHQAKHWDRRGCVQRVARGNTDWAVKKRVYHLPPWREIDPTPAALYSVAALNHSVFKKENNPSFVD